MKRLISILLSFTMLLSVSAGVDFSAYSQTSDEVTVVNPIYEDIADYDDLTEELDDISDDGTVNNRTRSASSYGTKAQAVSTLKKAMVNRTDSITINFTTTTSSTMSSLAQEMFEAAYAQENATAAQEGDYLKWHWKSYSCSGVKQYTSSGYNYSLSYTISYMTTADEEEEVDEKISEIISSLDLDGKSTYRQLKLIHDYVCEQIRYDYDHVYTSSYLAQYTTYAALFDGYAVCQAYATLFYRLCWEVDISTRVITSYYHAWNISELDGSFYNIDCTWDDTENDDTSDENGNYWSDTYTYNYFLCGSQEFDDSSHEREDEYLTDEFNEEYPMADSRYVCTHSDIEYSVPDGADCTVGFDMNKVCANCGEILGTETVSATSHTYSEEIIAATCTTDGYTLHTCTLCGNSYESDAVEATGHTVVTDKAVAATCTSTGLTKGSHCSVCGTVITAQTTVAKLGHTYKSVVTKATLEKNGKIVKSCTRSGCSAKTTTTIYYPKTIKLSSTSYTYDGETHKPSVTVKDSKGNKISSKYYTVTYSNSKSKYVGKYTVKIKFKGNYSGTKTLTYTIKPRATTISKITAKSKGFTVKWSRKTAQTTGYQIQYSTSKDFSNAKTVTISKNSTGSKTISKLKAKKKYYVRVRTYKTVK
ncbi:MAG: fibronectin type III domain-containing protein, partial [Clostridiales bacterium]|nr:fibronectin type III domain-containing protein [Clostridiales bacterium]